MITAKNNFRISGNQKGLLFGLLASVTFATYVLINRYVYLNYDVGVFRYVTTFMVAGGCFALLGLILEHLRNKISVVSRHILPVALNGVIASVGLGLFVFGQSYTTAINAGILATSTVIATVIFSKYLLKEQLSRWQVVWLMVMFLGLYLAIVGTSLINFGKGETIILASAIVLGFTNTFSKILMKHNSSNFVADVRLVSGGLFFILMGFIISGSNFLVLSAGLWPVISGFFFWLTIKCFYGSVQYISPNKAIVLANSHPIFTPIAGVLLLSEPYSLIKFVGAVLILISIYFISKK